MVATANSVSVWYHDGSSLSDSGMMERLGLDDRASDEGSLEMGPGRCKVSNRGSFVDGWSEGELGEDE